MLSYRVVLKPEHLELRALDQILNLKEICYQILSKIELCQLLAGSEILQAIDLIEGERTYLNVRHVSNQRDFFEIITP